MVKRVLDHSTRMFKFTLLQCRKLISYLYAIVTYFRVRRIHNNKFLLFILQTALSLKNESLIINILVK